MLCTPLVAENKILDYPTFELLSGAWKEKEKEWRRYDEEDAAVLERFATNYQKKSHLLFSQAPRVNRIPRTIHFIWVGPKPFPPESVENVKVWKELHPDWVLKFWTDSYERPCPVAGMEKHLIDEIAFTHLKPYLSRTKNYGEKADIIRYEILYNEGGMYVDHDVRAYRCFDTLHSVFDFYVGLENPHINEGTGTKVFPCNCLFAARPRHPIVKRTIKLVEARWDEVEKRYPGQDTTSNFNRVINRTFHSFTMATKECLNLEGNSDMVLPSSFFFGHMIFTERTLQKLRASGLVYAKHDFAAAWTVKKKDSSSSSKSDKKRKK